MTRMKTFVSIHGLFGTRAGILRLCTEICLETNQRLNISLNRSTTGVCHGNAGRALANVRYMGTQMGGVAWNKMVVGANVRLDTGNLIPSTQHQGRKHR